jgi:hypothetical protein
MSYLRYLCCLCILQNFNFLKLVYFLLAMKLTSDFYKVQISTNYEHNIIGFVVLSIARAISDTILLVVKEITRINKRNRPSSCL